MYRILRQLLDFVTPFIVSKAGKDVNILQTLILCIQENQLGVIWIFWAL